MYINRVLLFIYFLSFFFESQIYFLSIYSLIFLNKNKLTNHLELFEIKVINFFNKNKKIYKILIIILVIITKLFLIKQYFKL